MAQTWEDNDTVTYAYDNSGGLASVHDSALGRTTKYYYDFTDRLMKYAVTGSSYSHTVEYKYDATNKLLELVETVNGTVLTTSYTYDVDNRVTSVTTTTEIPGDDPEQDVETTVTEEYTYDDYGRLATKVTKRLDTAPEPDVYVTVLTESYTYRETDNGNPTTQVASVVGRNGSNVGIYSYSYAYDANGNITRVWDVINQLETTYAYDSANQLTRENNQTVGKTWIWTYDNAGNITSKKEYAYTTDTLGTATETNYTYGEKEQENGWGDLLTALNSQNYAYDSIGNLTGDGAWNYTWEHGRQLQKMSKTDNSAEWTFTYDADGMRTGRTNGTTTYEYVYNGGQLTQMTLNGEPVTFGYDASGKPETLTYRDATYYYLTNLQGDVIGIADGNGTRLVYYYYSAYGTVYASMNANQEDLASSLIAANPLMYRGYVYDQGIGLYYLQSRYYNPTLGRFINADALVATGQGMLGNNMFAYCLNNPLCGSDPCGTCFHRWDFWNDCDLCGGMTVQQKTANNIGTLSVGISGSFSLGFWCFGVQWTGSMDFKGNVEWQITPYGGLATGTPGGDASVFLTATNAPSVENLRGMGYSVGVTGALVAALGVDLNIIPDQKESTTYLGGTVSGGLGVGADAHIVWGETIRVHSYNIFELLEYVLGGST